MKRFIVLILTGLLTYCSVPQILAGDVQVYLARQLKGIGPALKAHKQKQAWANLGVTVADMNAAGVRQDVALGVARELLLAEKKVHDLGENPTFSEIEQVFLVMPSDEVVFFSRTLPPETTANCTTPAGADSMAELICPANSSMGGIPGNGSVRIKCEKNGVTSVGIVRCLEGT